VIHPSFLFRRHASILKDPEDFQLLHPCSIFRSYLFNPPTESRKPFALLTKFLNVKEMRLHESSRKLSQRSVRTWKDPSSARLTGWDLFHKFLLLCRREVFFHLPVRFSKGVSSLDQKPILAHSPSRHQHEGKTASQLPPF